MTRELEIREITAEIHEPVHLGPPGSAPKVITLWVALSDGTFQAVRCQDRTAKRVAKGLRTLAVWLEEHPLAGDEDEHGPDPRRMPPVRHWQRDGWAEEVDEVIAPQMLNGGTDE